jgi:hypothetical protein
MSDQRLAFERQEQLIATQSCGHPGSRHNSGEHLKKESGVAGVQELQNREGYWLGLSRSIKHFLAMLFTLSYLASMTKPAKTFKELIVWQKAHRFVLAIYSLTKTFPSSEIYCLTSQMRRAAISIPANIAEGFRKRGENDKTRFLNIAQGSPKSLATI